MTAAVEEVSLDVPDVMKHADFSWKSLYHCQAIFLPEIRTPSCVKDKLKKSYHFEKDCLLLLFCCSCEPGFIVVAIVFFVDYFVHIELGKYEANTQFIYKDMAFLSNDLKFSYIGQFEKICRFKCN